MASRLLNGSSMRWTCACLLVLLAGCDDGAPPFEDLPLRDALRADPTVLAGLSNETRSRLASRFEAARAEDRTVDEIQGNSDTGPSALAAAVDRVRQQRQAEPLLLGLIHDGAAWPVGGDGAPSVAALPPLEGQTAGATAAG